MNWPTTDDEIIRPPQLDSDVIEKALMMVLAAESSSVTSVPIPKNCRAYECSHPTCTRPAFAKGLCNAHYIRKRLGKDMDLPFYNRLSGALCRQCESPLDGKGGWNLCARHYRNRRGRLLKRTLLTLLGAQCNACGLEVHPAALDFHHTSDDKEAGIANMIWGSGALKELAKEAAKCILLCANCHRIHHYEMSTEDALANI